MPRPRIPDRRSALLNAAEEQILRHGFDAVRIADIAREAGVGKGAFYLEFPSKESILQALLIRSMGRMAARSQQILDATPDADLSLGRVYRTGIDALLADRLAVAAMLDDGAILGHQVKTLGPQRYAARHEWVRIMLRAFAEHGAIADDVDIDGLAIVLSSTTLGLLSASSAFGPLTEKQLANALDSLTALVERGTSTAQPIQDATALRNTLVGIVNQLRAQIELDQPA